MWGHYIYQAVTLRFTIGRILWPKVRSVAVRAVPRSDVGIRKSIQRKRGQILFQQTFYTTMASKWPVFLTATNVEPKILNKAWILIQDYEFTDPEDEPSFILLTSANLPDSTPKGVRQFTTTTPIADNDLADLSMDKLRDLIQSKISKFQDLNITTENWVMIDQTSLESEQCILVNRIYDDEAEEISWEIQALRIPLTEVYSMYANLDIANMDFEDWVDEDTGVQEDGTYKWAGAFEPSNEHIEKSEIETDERRDAALKAAKDLGHID
ncbi:hypothetical protein BT63DRAFT_176896 [Microthyrium microscopicum]|uniref:DUF6924 domain-containing protein n=1 Tax=Microthyrium microscopicum TaxID=703497 RepID=A0A6A6UKS6_9PEZI|nr:hypothetical protein BT63DRAFT_176896 [Microthyrium microscopicum]